MLQLIVRALSRGTVWTCLAALAWISPTPAQAPPATAEAATAEEMKPYTQEITGTSVKFDMVPIPGGVFRMGSPDDEAGRADDEGPVHEVEIAPFWMGTHEVTWDQYELWMFSLEKQRREAAKHAPTELDRAADAVTRPTKPYTDMTFGMGKEGYPAICMTQLAAKTFCEWLSAKTGHYYRLPTEAEWEYACRAGADTAYSFGDDVGSLDDYAWSYQNSEDAYHQVGLKKPNAWGLYDMHGNVAEWCLDQYVPDAYAARAGKKTANPFVRPTQVYPQVVRGGSWDDDPEKLRCAARRGSEKSWKMQDPQIPQSKWYFTDALFAGFRVVRPLHEPSAAEKEAFRAAEADVE